MTDFISLVEASPVVIGMTEKTPMEIIGRMVDACVAEGRLPADARDTVFEAIWQRELSGSTALTNGIAFPHARTDRVPEMVAAIGIHREGLPYGSLDNGLTRIFVLLIEPLQSAVGHIHFFALMSQKLLDDRIRERLLIAKTREEVVEILCGSRSAAADDDSVPLPEFK